MVIPPFFCSEGTVYDVTTEVPGLKTGNAIFLSFLTEKLPKNVATKIFAYHKLIGYN
jgi:hypothetical protein